VADLRTATPIPELPEAAAREGIAFLATVAERDGRRKTVLQAATPEQVEEFLRMGNELRRECYGDPARGFAGMYE